MKPFSRPSYFFCYEVQAPLASASPQSENGGLYQLYWLSDTNRLRKVVKWLSQWLNGLPHRNGQFLIAECIRALQVGRLDAQVVARGENDTPTKDLRDRLSKPLKEVDCHEICIHVTFRPGVATTIMMQSRDHPHVEGDATVPPRLSPQVNLPVERLPFTSTP